jgi:hypothetical protein
MDRNRFPEKYKKLTIVIPPADEEEKRDVCPAPKHLSYCILTMANCIPHRK